ncbi:MAG: ash family protein [Pluralibacter sp.]|nr:ash family protein [Pluralibacter sp.]
MGTLNDFTGDTRRVCAFFCVVRSATSQWWGRAGALQSAPVSVRPVVPTPFGSTTHEIGTSGGGNDFVSLEAALWLQPSTRHTHYSPSLSALTPISPSSPPTATNSRLPWRSATIRCCTWHSADDWPPRSRCSNPVCSTPSRHT